MSEKELDFILAEFATKNLDEEIYRYQSHWGLSVVYYMVDFRKAFQGMIEPIYLCVDDIKPLGLPEDELFNRILGNTMVIMGIECMRFSDYLRELRQDCEGEIEAKLIDGITRAMDEVSAEKQPLCITSSIRDRGAVGAFSTQLLQKICEEQKAEKILIGVGCHDYALVMHATEENAHSMEWMTYRIGNIRERQPQIEQRGILQYDSSTGTLSQWMEV